MSDSLSRMILGCTTHPPLLQVTAELENEPKPTTEPKWGFPKGGAVSTRWHSEKCSLENEILEMDSNVALRLVLDETPKEDHQSCYSSSNNPLNRFQSGTKWCTDQMTSQPPVKPLWSWSHCWSTLKSTKGVFIPALLSQTLLYFTLNLLCYLPLGAVPLARFEHSNQHLVGTRRITPRVLWRTLVGFLCSEDVIWPQSYSKLAYNLYKREALLSFLNVNTFVLHPFNLFLHDL